MKLCSYVVVYDKGFAPNPFWGFCTMAACTPNHQGLRLQRGDWLLGNSSATNGHRLVYAMCISEVLGFDEYYGDPRFAAKRARDENWQQRCGDNIYFRDEAGRWKQGVAFHHTDARNVEKDTRHPRVFVSDHFFYFGENAIVLPHEYASLIRTSQGCRCSHKAETVLAFVRWLEQTYPAGPHGQPRDREETTASLVRLNSPKGQLGRGGSSCR